MMKKRRSIAELIDGIRKTGEDAENGYGFSAFEGDDGMNGRSYIERLGKAFLARLNIPDGMDEREAAERIIRMWNESDARRLSGSAAGKYDEDESTEEDEMPDGGSYASSGYGKRHAPRLPSPIRGGLFEAPKADYESMSAEQFRRLKKQLERASMDGRRIRL